MKSVLVLALSLISSGFAVAQTAPVTPADVFAGQDVNKQLAAAVEKAAKSGSGGGSLGSYGSHNIQLSVRTKSGGGEIHKHFTDIFYVVSGTATLITGGEIPDAKENAPGEIRGTEVKNGKSQVLTPGTVVNIPAGTPHQLIIPEGSTYQAVVVKVKES